MFRSITFRSQETNIGQQKLDIGLLLECMLFYEQVTVLANSGILKLLIEHLGGDCLAELIENGFLDVVYLNDNPAIMNHTKGLKNSILTPIFFSMEKLTFQNQLWKHCIDVTGKSGKGRRLALRLEKKISVSKHGDNLGENAIATFLDQTYLRSAFKTILTGWIPSLVWDDKIEINTYKNEAGFGFESDLNFYNLTQHFREINPGIDSAITPELVFSKMLDAETHLYFSSKFLTELVADPIGSTLLSDRVSKLASVVSGNTKHNSFSECILNGSITFREAINSNQISIQDAIDIILKSHKFKDWLKKNSSEKEALQEYMNTLSENPFLSTLPGKTIRFAIFGGLGVAVGTLGTPALGIGLGLSLNVFDIFLVEKLMNGWKPNQFVNDVLKKKIQ